MVKYALGCFAQLFVKHLVTSYESAESILPWNRVKGLGYIRSIHVGCSRVSKPRV